jgi:hypothetical protein
MRASVSAVASDRVSSAAVVLAGLLCGVSMFFVALPLANSSPFPTPREGGWIADDDTRESARDHRQVAAASSYHLASLSSRLTPPPVAIPDHLDVQATIEWEARIGSAGVLDLPPPQVSREDVQTTAALPEAEAVKPAALASLVPAASAAEPPASAAPAKRALSPQEEVDEYLWQVYQRSPIKKDGAGDFTWKDPAAAKRLKMSLKDYVIGGMNKDFREQLYHAGKAMDEAGLNWTILSGFRDDYRQQIAAGIKAATGNSLHGGSRATGGYGDGRAADIVNADGDHSAIWRWIDRNGAKYGLSRPMPGYDPAHVQTGGNWHAVAMALRAKRTGITEVAQAQPAPQAAARGGKRARYAHAR